MIPLLEEGIAALQGFDRDYGCSWDASDLELIAGIFRRLDRDPTDVELFQIAQANSEHSRHWVFKGELWVDGVRVPERNLMDIVRQPLDGFGAQLGDRLPRRQFGHPREGGALLAASEPLEPVASRADAGAAASHAHRRDPQLPLGGGPLSRRGDRRGRAHP